MSAERYDATWGSETRVRVESKMNQNIILWKQIKSNNIETLVSLYSQTNLFAWRQMPWLNENCNMSFALSKSARTHPKNRRSCGKLRSQRLVTCKCQRKSNVDSRTNYDSLDVSQMSVIWEIHHPYCYTDRESLLRFHNRLDLLNKFGCRLGLSFAV